LIFKTKPYHNHYCNYWQSWN